MGTAYNEDVVVWTSEQAALLCSGQLLAINIQHIAEEIEDVGKSEQRKMASRMVALLAHLLKWQFQPDRGGASWGKNHQDTTMDHDYKQINCN